MIAKNEMKTDIDDLIRSLDGLAEAVDVLGSTSIGENIADLCETKICDIIDELSSRRGEMDVEQCRRLYEVGQDEIYDYISDHDLWYWLESQLEGDR